ncbi:MAG: hypothetical protein ABIQ39_08430 [Ilumatobacteraceae bacterium]
MDVGGDVDCAVHPHRHRLGYTVDDSEPDLAEGEPVGFERQPLESGYATDMIVAVDCPSGLRIISKREAQNFCRSIQIVNGCSSDLDRHAQFSPTNLNRGRMRRYALVL